MSSDLAISVRGLSKSYSIRHQDEKHITLAEQALSLVRHPFRRAPKETFWALDDVSFEVRQGEVLGIIGRNGAGKSTLLKVLSRITAPTKGEVRLYGRVGSLLEVGTGFHPELTGRENVYLNGSILGMNRREIDRQFDAIVDFAGVEHFLDTPVKRYSSGMYVRLAFAVAAHLETEILLVDEVLAVGDAEFQKKCLGKIGEVSRQGRTVLLVSHSQSSVRALASSCVLLDSGRVELDGSTDAVLATYAEMTRVESTGRLDDRQRGPWAQTGELRLTEVHALPPSDGGDICELMVTVENIRFNQGSFGLVVTLNRNASPVGTVTVDGIDAPSVGLSRSVAVQVDTRTIVPGHYQALLAAVTFAGTFGHTNHDIVPDAIGLHVDGARSRALLAGRQHWPDTWGAHALNGGAMQSEKAQRSA